MHIPVLFEKTRDLLEIKTGDVCVDMTVGLGGHTQMLIDAVGNAGTVIGVDRDEKTLELAKNKLLNKHAIELKFFHSSFSEIEKLILESEFADRVLFDLGISSWQLDNPERGFAINNCGPLDMRMDILNSEVTAAVVVNSYNEEKIINILKEYGDEPLAARIAKAICMRRKKKFFETTDELAALISGVYYAKGWKRSKVHPATKSFQALRIEVNNEYAALKKGMATALKMLKPNGRIAIISFHSGEDRIVKHTFKAWKQEDYGEIITKKPITAEETEIKDNPRSRSALLRVFQKKEK